ncbi:MAG: glycosyltransferase family 2 protein [Hyphomicrobium sp.]|uniref:glycosyltransferase n=1 Tax=Hyphomicrobium sp. TaxID=82 RepID=UPI001323524B|nr:glycosyltransferase [Hyphomicrobium sp.]KAB2937178.1 MAG: glycosyltransferase family 2 protein [Hyphomicrobium sp.]MBZ0210510.1 glycosyltransferase family 2 protein [Hyphomicrobium sp.]
MLDEALGSAWTFLVSLSPYALLSIFWFTALLEIPRYFLSFAATIVVLSLRSRRPLSKVPPLKVSIVIAGHNEAGSIDRCVSSLREQTLTAFEIICVDDGSTDGTFNAMRRLERQGRVQRTVRCQLRGGKPAAVNLAARLATGDILVVIDADCSFERTAIEELVRPFAEPGVVAVSGNILIRNWQKSVITSLQAIEYLISISLGKTTSDVFNQVTCVSGAFGAFRKAAWERAGGLDPISGEDFDLTMRLRIAGGRVIFARRAVCYTDAPETLMGLAHQRNRWERDAFWIRFRKFRRTLTPSSDGIRWQETIHQLDFFVFNVACAMLFPFYVLGLFLQFGEFAFIVLLAAGLGLYLLDGLSFALAAWITGKAQYWKLAPFLLLYGPFQSYVMRFIRLWAYVDEWIFSKSREDNYIPAKVRAWSIWR